jgi:hypothetical protein
MSKSVLKTQQPNATISTVENVSDSSLVVLPRFFVLFIFAQLV